MKLKTLLKIRDLSITSCSHYICVWLRRLHFYCHISLVITETENPAYSWLLLIYKWISLLKKRIRQQLFIKLRIICVTFLKMFSIMDWSNQYNQHHCLLTYFLTLLKKKLSVNKRKKNKHFLFLQNSYI